MTDWFPDLSHSNAPRYMAIADRIEADIKAGTLLAGDRLPAQRQLAEKLGVDFTTVARGYAEARRRGVISSQVGSGTFVTDRTAPDPDTTRPQVTSRFCPPDHSMNLPPEPDQTDLVVRMQQGMAALSSDLTALLRYQVFDASCPDLSAAQTWVRRSDLEVPADRIAITPGAQSALFTIVSLLTQQGGTLLCEAVTYPGIRSICAQLNVPLKSAAMDKDGILPDALEEACSTEVRAVYLNPTLHNPTTRTMSHKRRQEIAAVAQRMGIAILEDDPYRLLMDSPPAPIADLAPDVTWYITSMAKTLGAGLRLGYVVAPSSKARWQLTQALRSACIMPSPLSSALAALWIEDGTADAILSSIQSECRARHSLLAERFKHLTCCADPSGFHAWLKMKNGWSRSAFVGQLRDALPGLIESDAFTVSGQPEEAVRLCLGGPVKRPELAVALDRVAHTLDMPPERSSIFF